ncbi:NitT/TauT family transport system substrate-binding protein [Loktanella fryxellensis]|uniref:NitT/TauT family transport system substrate-binding protein n=1 Tax=Loktanella fryxellensis TaxID=245187 RepID=A0A1H8FXV8_9RHOB|nr:ABC transporter substrate-binding protein [Loktanella fryxellensis]SEN36365.1 NitT/TauT family transport system substrate-binding protein [Loktanella fryxellensis]
MFYRMFTAALLLASTAHAQTDLPFALDWKFEGPAAPYFAAIDNGHFEAAGLNVTLEAGNGSLEAIPKVATGAFPVGFADINSLIKFLDQNPGAPVIAAMMVYDKPPFAVIGRTSLGISDPKSLEGKVLGAPPPDGAWAQFPIFAAENDLDMAAITVEPVGFPTREPMLAEGNVAAITGFSFTSTLNAARLGVPADDLVTLLMADYGVDLYGNAVIVNTDYAAENPEVIEGFLAAVAAGWNDAIADPAAVMPMLMERNPAADAALEQERLELSIRDNVNTDWVQANGFGGIDADRMQSSLAQIATTYEFATPPDAALYFTDAYLPEGGFKLTQ